MVIRHNKKYFMYLSGIMIYVIDLFCGCGGFSEGAKQAGASVKLAVDNWDKALSVHNKNHPDPEHWNIELGIDVEKLSSKLK